MLSLKSLDFKIVQHTVHYLLNEKKNLLLIFQNGENKL